MNLEQQVCSLELARRLKELGVEQKSVFYWYDTSLIENEIMWHIHYIDYNHAEADRKIFCENKETYSAFTVAELGMMLPLYWDCCKREDNYYLCRIYEIHSDKSYNTFADTEANARAKMLIYLIENKLI